MKRARSSESLDFTPQMKLHVTQKEVNLGVQSSNLMKKVYEKTLNYLKEGAKIESPNSKMFNLSALTQKHSSAKRNMRQMVLGDNLSLQSSEKDVDHVPLIDMCGCGQIIRPINCAICCYCGEPLCQECTAECIKCRQNFCKQCSLTVYDQVEHQICLDCLS